MAPINDLIFNNFIYCDGIRATVKTNNPNYVLVLMNLFKLLYFVFLDIYKCKNGNHVQ